MLFFQGQSLRIEVQPGQIAELWIDVPGHTHNFFGRPVLQELAAALDRVASDSSLKLLVLLSRKPASFCAGADLNEFTTIRGPEDAMALSAAGQQLFGRLADLRVPTVAVVHGPCLGGGLEFALACDYRVIIDQPGTLLGLPEIELGLLPGWGGTQRLPRVIGAERALRVILGRHRLGAAEALEWGLADAVQPSQEKALEFVTGELANHARKRPKTGLPLRTWRQRLLESTALGRGLLFRGAERVLKRRTPDDMPAPLEALQAVKVGLAHGMQVGLEYERQAIGRLATTKACRNLVTLFFLIERARKPEGGEAAGSARAIRRVGIVGAGTMGAGIAQLAAVKGFEVTVQEVDEAALAAGMNKIEALFARAVQRRVLSSEEAQQKLAKIGRTTSWEGFGDADLVVEAVIEELNSKRDVFRELARRCRPDAILATNTSSLSVRELQDGLDHPERVAGLHFFNPVHKMPLVEVARAPQTGEATLATLMRWAAALGKTPVAVGDSPGFVVNRILMPYLNEAGMLVAEGLSIEQVDQVMRRFGMPMGPLELLDQVGLDVAAHIARAMKPVFGARLTPHPALEQMCTWGWLGQKSGLGFYRYQGKSKTANTEALPRLRAQTGTGPPAPDTRLTAERLHEARERMVTLMVNEAAACLGEGLAPRADVIDLAMVLGTGWAPHRGGPLRYADDRGAADLLKTLLELRQRIGPRFEPCAELRQRAETGECFYSSLLVPPPG